MRQNLPVTHKEYRLPTDQTIVSVTDPQGRIVYCNNAFVDASGYSRSELMGQPHNLIRHPDVPAEAFRDLWATIQSGRPWTAPVKNRRKNGDHYWVVANATPMTRNGQIIGYLSVRTVPPREMVDAAEALFARMRAEAESGRLVTGLRGGRVVRLDWPGRVAEAVKDLPRHVGADGLAAACAVAGAVAATALLPLAVALPVAAGLAGAGAWAARRAVQRPFVELRETMLQLAAGDLTTAIPSGDRGLAGQVQRALSQLSLNLRTVVEDVRIEIQGVRGSVGEIAAGNHDLSQRTEAQAGSLEKTAASMEQISGTVKQSAASAQEGAQVAVRTTELANQGGQAVAGLVQAMQDISESSRRIGEILHVIEGVAFQTNILALNAAVEAARAGESGRGFAVVAGEVRSLAQRTTEAAREIKQLIAESDERVSSGQTQTHQAHERIQEVVAAVKSVSTLLSGIDTAAREQHLGVAQVNEAVLQIDHITQQNAAMVEELAAAAQALDGQVVSAVASIGLFRLHEGDRTHAESDAVSMRREAKSTDSQAGLQVFNLGDAVAAHLKWKTTLRLAMQNREQLDAERIGRDDCCPLGQWLHGEGHGRWGTRPRFRELVSRHEKFHQCAAQVARLINAGQATEAARAMQSGSDYSSATQAVVNAIRALQSDIGNTKTAAEPQREAVAA